MPYNGEKKERKCQREAVFSVEMKTISTCLISKIIFKRWVVLGKYNSNLITLYILLLLLHKSSEFANPALVKPEFKCKLSSCQILHITCIFPPFIPTVLSSWHGFLTPFILLESQVPSLTGNVLAPLWSFYHVLDWLGSNGKHGDFSHICE